MSDKFRRREMPIDLGQQKAGHRAPQENADGSDAAKDYFGNLKRFERHENPAAEPNRNKGGDLKKK